MKRKNMSKEKKDLVQEKDRLRKKKEREHKAEEKRLALKQRIRNGDFAHKGEYLLAKDRRFTQFGRTTDGKSEKWKTHYFKMSQRYWREGRSEIEVEFYMIEDLLSKRKKRQLRNGKEHLLDNLAATKGMRLLKELGPIKDREFMRRKARAKDEEVLWQMFWERGDKYKDFLQKTKPDYANLFREKVENERKKKEERDRIEKELDEQGRWNYDNSSSEYYWSIPDANGHHMSLAEFNKEENEIPLTIEEQLETLKRKLKGKGIMRHMLTSSGSYMTMTMR